MRVNKTLPARITDRMQRINHIIDAKYATINFEMQRTKCIFVVKYATNENFHTSTG